MKSISLFSGYLGLDLGAKMALGDLDTILWADIEPGPRALCRFHAPDADEEHDVTVIDWSKLPHVDVLTGGSPCQSVSLAGLRAGMREGTRSGLWSCQADAIAALRPNIMIHENVSGILSAAASGKYDVTLADRRAAKLRAAGLCGCDEPDLDLPDGVGLGSGEAVRRADDALLEWALAHDRDVSNVCCNRCGLPVFERANGGLLSGGARLGGVDAQPSIRALGRVLGDLANLGYDAAWRAVEAADVGAPHHRLRVFTVAWPHRDGDEPSGAWARWDGGLDAWVTGQPSLFDEPIVFYGSWPKSCVMVAGAASAPPVSVPAPSVRDMARLLPTPSALYDSEKAGSLDWSRGRAEAGRQLGLADAVNLLPTPIAHDARGGKTPEQVAAARAQGYGVSNLNETVVNELLPTPIARDAGIGGPMSPEAKRAGGHAVTLQDVVERGGLLPTPAASDGGKFGASDPGELRASETKKSVHLCDEVGALLPTPIARDVKGNNARHNQDCLPGAVEMGMALLPTPVAGDGGKGGPNARHGGGDRPLSSALLPTPAATDGDGRGPVPVADRKAGGHSVHLADTICDRTVDWGRFAPAIRRWERVLGRPAPDPSQISGSMIRWARGAQDNLFDPDWLAERCPGCENAGRMADWGLWGRIHAGEVAPDEVIGATRLPHPAILNAWAKRQTRRISPACLSPRFVEWMMGLPDGWVTDPAIWRDVPGNHRNLQLRALGNGVCPQQAAAAIRWALKVRETI